MTNGETPLGASPFVLSDTVSSLPSDVETDANDVRVKVRLFAHRFRVDSDIKGELLFLEIHAHDLASEGDPLRDRELKPRTDREAKMIRDILRGGPDLLVVWAANAHNALAL